MENLAYGISGAATIPLSSTDHTLTTTNDGEAMRFVLILTGALTANVNLIVPAESRVYVVDNRTTGAFIVTCRPAAGGGVAVDQSARTLIYCDSANVYPVASGTGGGGGSGAPTDASYLVGASHTLLSGERVVTDTPTITWDLGTAGQARALIPADAVSYTHIQNVASSRLLGRFTAGAGDVQEITPGTGLALDTGTGVLSAAAVGQPLDATLTALAGLATGANQLPYSTGTDTFAQTPLTAFARTVLDDADAATVRGTISAQASDATLTALAGVTTGADTLPFFTGVDTASTTTLTAFMRSLLDDPDLATAQATLGITAGGGYTDEQAQDAIGAMLVDSATIDLTYTDATPALTAAVVAGSIGTTQLANDAVTYAKLQNVTDARLLGRSAGSAGDAQEITVGTGLSLSAGALTATGGAAYTNEEAQDAVGGILTNTPAIVFTYNDTTPSISAALGFGGVASDRIADDAITYAKLQNVSSTDRLLGRASAGPGNAEELVCTAAGRALLDDADTTTQRTTLGLGTVATQNYTTGSFTATGTGFTAVLTGTATYVIIGRQVTLVLPALVGTSNATTFTVTGIPAAIQTSVAQFCLVPTMDNNVWSVGLLSAVASGTWPLYSNGGGTAWTASGSKGMQNCVITYLLP